MKSKLLPGEAPDLRTGGALDWRDAKRALVVATASEELGPQAKGSARVREYWARVCPEYWTEAQTRQAAGKLEWCGIFALWCLHESGVTDAKWELGKGFVWQLKRTAEPEPGDVFVGPGPMWHHGVVERYEIVNERPWLTSVEGNTPDVRRRSRPAPAAFSYYTIDSWLDTALEAENARLYQES